MARAPGYTKRYCLLENGRILATHFPDESLRNFEKRGNHWYVTYDHYAHQMIITYCHKVVKFSDNFDELHKEAKKYR